MSSKAESEFAIAARDSRPRKHSDSLPGKPERRELDIAIKRLLRTQTVSSNALLELFDGRATVAAITGWRYGWRGTPQWAAELIRAKLAAQAAADLAAGARIRVTIGKGWNKGAKTLAAWRERKARERDAKEKAAEIAALHRAPENET